MSEILDQRQFAQPTRTGLPAWALSVIMHALGFLLLGLLIRNVAQSATSDPGRPVAIVLAQETGGDDLEFIDGEADSDSSQSSASGGAQSQETVLPPGELSDANELFPDIALPGASLGGGTDEAVTAPQLSVNASTKILPGAGDGEIIAAEAAARRAANRGPQGPPASVSLFGSAPATGHSFVFVIDRSKSMGGRGLNALVAAEKELIAALAKLDRNHKFEIIAYHNRPVYFSQKYFRTKQLVPATPENKARVSEFFGGLAPFGHTEHGMAMKTALYLEPDVVYLLTDGGEPGMTDHEMRRVAQLAGGATTIHCIQFGSGKRRFGAFMQRLARDNRGGYGYVDMSGARNTP